MNLIQVLGSDGTEVGLFTFNQDKCPQNLINLCEKNAQNKCDNDESLDLSEVFEEELEEVGFSRTFVEEVITNIW